MSPGNDEWSRLMRAGLAGDAAAYRDLLQAMAPVLRGIVRARGPGLGADEGEDVVQDILLAIHLKRGTWNPGQPLRPWVYAIARHKLVDAFRRRGRRIHLPVEDFAEVLENEAPPDPFEASDAARLIDRLEPRDAALLRCLALEGQGSEVCGARLNLSPGALRVALHRALKRLAVIRVEDER
ncbi:sigma-70 family RNA polymerase sigma factor [Paracoccus sp. TK19116]|uniref:Sigma-70 family RNA polymerase sigma factor n=1 Tax=Paracoccus albicereus TaxID=2922394 RepID=A0ABT1MPM3_9RHOB|nr:sigma-70 family RNA polymerase sigma factor [Paracoccus albicereus]MCQ0970247.1 sigma-70 family RNA polymerase sigma factor [Paracoccus albicereus]